MKSDNLQFKIGNRVSVHAYKFNGWLYRTWDLPMIIEENDDYIVLANDKTFVITSEYKTKRYFHSENLNQIYWIFFKKEWFNILISVKKNKKIQYYVNVASRYLIEEEAIKYVDFEIDFKIFSNLSWIEVDKKEFIQAQSLYNYPDSLIKKVDITTAELTKICNERKISDHFSKEKIAEFEKKFLELKEGEI
ncbi:MAG: DUF402 domain-containing protein [Mycoplasma sp.]